MLRTFLRSKIHRATVTEADLDYEGSITLDPALMDAARLAPYELVHVLNLNSGSRFETYVIAGRRGTGTVCVNGAAARLAQRGDKVIILSYIQTTSQPPRHYAPVVVHVNDRNKVVKASRRKA